jgi:predicted negative regulator of RcsB-dependent stress response
MAQHLDLEEQEQLDQLKHFWNQYGNLISLVLIAVFGTFAAWNGYQYWQRSQATQAAAMFDEVERVVKGGDAAKVQRAFEDMRDRFPSTAYAQQAALLVAKAQQDAGQSASAQKVLEWIAVDGKDPGLAAIGKLRLAAVHMEAKAYDAALKVLEGSMPAEFVALQADRRGDIFVLQGKRDQARQAFEAAYKDLDERADYRRLVEVKLLSLGGSVPVTEAAK